MPMKIMNLFFFRHPRQCRPMKKLCRKIIDKWSRTIFHNSGEFGDLSRDERVTRDKQMAEKTHATEFAARKKAKFEADCEREKELRPGDYGWIPRARVPMVETREYVSRPEWQNQVDFDRKQIKKGISLLEKHKRNFAERRRNLKAGHSVKISIEGKNM